MKIIRLGVHIFEMLLVIAGILFFMCKAGSIDTYVVLSGSMNPVIETGSIVLVDTKNRDYVIGDIITYNIDDQLVTHRIVEINEEIYRTKGDANVLPDSVSVKKNQILGKVIYIIPKAGYIVAYLKSEKIIFVMLTVLFLSNLFDILSEKNIQKKASKNQERGKCACAHGDLL